MTVKLARLVHRVVKDQPQRQLAVWHITVRQGLLLQAILVQLEPSEVTDLERRIPVNA